MSLSERPSTKFQGEAALKLAHEKSDAQAALNAEVLAAMTTLFELLPQVAVEIYACIVDSFHKAFIVHEPVMVSVAAQTPAASPVQPVTQFHRDPNRMRGLRLRDAVAVYFLETGNAFSTCDDIYAGVTAGGCRQEDGNTELDRRSFGGILGHYGRQHDPDSWLERVSARNRPSRFRIRRPEAEPAPVVPVPPAVPSANGAAAAADIPFARYSAHEAAEAILREEENTPMTIQAITDIAVARGWNARRRREGIEAETYDPSTAFEVALRTHPGLFERTEPATYRLQPEVYARPATDVAIPLPQLFVPPGAPAALAVACTDPEPAPTSQDLAIPSDEHIPTPADNAGFMHDYEDDYDNHNHGRTGS